MNLIKSFHKYRIVGSNEFLLFLIIYYQQNVFLKFYLSIPHLLYLNSNNEFRKFYYLEEYLNYQLFDNVIYFYKDLIYILDFYYLFI